MEWGKPHVLLLVFLCGFAASSKNPPIKPRRITQANKSASTVASPRRTVKPTPESANLEIPEIAKDTKTAKGVKKGTNSKGTPDSSPRRANDKSGAKQSSEDQKPIFARPPVTPPSPQCVDHKQPTEVPHSVDHCLVCAAVVDQVRRYLTVDEWDGTVVPGRMLNNAARAKSKKFVISELRAMEVVEKVCQSILFVESIEEVARKGVWEDRYALLVQGGVGKFVPTRHANGTNRVWKYHGDSGILQPKAAVAKLVGFCEDILNEQEEHITLTIMKGKASQLRATMCLENLKKCTPSELDVFISMNILDPH